MLNGCETWSLTLSGDCRLRIFENRILRRIFESKKDENGEWRRLYNQELHTVRVIKHIILRWAGHVTRMERVKRENGYQLKLNFIR